VTAVHSVGSGGEDYDYASKPITHDTDLAKHLRDKHPGSGCCGRCGMPWAVRVVDIHSTYFKTEDGVQHGAFPLCEDCWLSLLHPEARVEYYVDLVKLWRSGGTEFSKDDEWNLMRAVANGG